MREQRQGSTTTAVATSAHERTQHSEETPVQQAMNSAVATFRQRLVNFRTMSWPLRAIVGFSVLQIVIVAALILTQNVPQPHADVTFEGEQFIRAPVVAFVFSSVLLCVSLTLLLTGAIAGHWIARVVVVGLFSGIVLLNLEPGIAGRLQIGVLAVVWLWALFVWWFPRLRERMSGGNETTTRVPPALTAILALAAVLANYTIAYVTNTRGFHDVFGVAERFADTIVFLGLPLTVVYFLAGSDLVETAETTAQAVGRFFAKPGRFWLLPVLTILSALAPLAYKVAQVSPGGLAHARPTRATTLEQVALVGLAAALLYAVVLIGRTTRWQPVPVPYGALVFASLVGVGLVTAVFLMLQATILPADPPSPPHEDFTVLKQTQQKPYFSIAYPKHWTEQVPPSGTGGQGSFAILTGMNDVYIAQVDVLGEPTTEYSGLAEFQDMLGQAIATKIIGEGKSGSLTFGHPYTFGGWRVSSYASAAGAPDTTYAGESRGLFYVRSDGLYDWVILAYTSNQGITAMTPLFNSMATSWRPDLSAQAPPSPDANYDPFSTRVFGLLLGLAPPFFGLVVGLPLLLAGRRRGGKRAVAGLYFLVFGIVDGLMLLNNEVAWLNPRRSGSLALNVFSLEAGAALLTLAVVLVLVIHRASIRQAAGVLLALLGLNAGFLAVFVSSQLYTSSQSTATAFTIQQAVLLVGAFLWDILTSGAEATNLDNRSFPRYTRILLYVGYTTLISASLLYDSTATLGTSSATARAFSQSDWANYGLLYLGVPLVVTIFLLGLSRRRGDGGSAHTAAAGASPAFAEVPPSLPVLPRYPPHDHAEPSSEVVQ